MGTLGSQTDLQCDAQRKDTPRLPFARCQREANLGERSTVRFSPPVAPSTPLVRLCCLARLLVSLFRATLEQPHPPERAAATAAWPTSRAWSSPRRLRRSSRTSSRRSLSTGAASRCVSSTPTARLASPCELTPSRSPSHLFRQLMNSLRTTSRPFFSNPMRQSPTSTSRRHTRTATSSPRALGCRSTRPRRTGSSRPSRGSKRRLRAARSGQTGSSVLQETRAGSCRCLTSTAEPSCGRSGRTSSPSR